MNEITFKLPDDAMRRVVKLNEKEYERKETMDCPIDRDVTARMLNDIAKQLGKTLLTKNQGVSYLMRCGFIPEEKKVSQDRFTFFVNPADTPFLLDLLDQKAELERLCEEQSDRKGEFMWEIEKLCCRIGNVLVLKNQGVLIDRASDSDKEEKKGSELKKD